MNGVSARLLNLMIVYLLEVRDIAYFQLNKPSKYVPTYHENEPSLRAGLIFPISRLH